MKKLIMALLLFVVAVGLAMVLFPIGIVYAIIYYLLKTKFTALGDKLYLYIFSIAYSIDQLGNVIMSEFFNFSLLISKEKPKPLFGNPDETISSVLGKNKAIANLTFIGWLLAEILHKLDPDHVEKSIEQEQNEK